MTETDPSTSNVFHAERLIMLSDGVFAIAITLLVLDIRLPALESNVPTEVFNAALNDLGHRFFSFVLSFVVIGLYWHGHHRLFRSLRHADTRLATLNFVMLFFIALMPFPTALISVYAPSQPGAVVVYALNIAATGIALAMLWVYAARGGLLLESVSARGVRKRVVLSLVEPVVFLVSIGITFIDPNLAMLFWLSALAARVALSRLNVW
jgi:uncharacterized membrane protein